MPTVYFRHKIDKNLYVSNMAPTVTHLVQCINYDMVWSSVINIETVTELGERRRQYPFCDTNTIVNIQKIEVL